MKKILTILFCFLFVGTVHAAAIKSTKSGLWSDPATWDLNRVPVQGDDITITAGTTVIYNAYSSNVIINKIVIEGTLRFSRTTNTRLDINNIIINEGSNGYLDMGTASDFIPANIHAEIYINVSEDHRFRGGMDDPVTPEEENMMIFESDHGIWIHGGRWDVHGAPIKNTWTKLVQDSGLGTTNLNKIIVAEDVSDWPIGGTVLVTSTDTADSVGPVKVNTVIVGAKSQDELRKIKSITNVGGLYQIELDAYEDVMTPNTGVNLKYLHLGRPNEMTGAFKTPRQGEIGLLSRNILIAGNTPRERGDQGHTRYQHMATGSLAYAEFRDLAPTGDIPAAAPAGTPFVIGRYPIHFHKPHDAGEHSRGMFVRGVSVWRSNFYVMSVHGANGLLIEDIVAYDIGEQGIYFEATACDPDQNVKPGDKITCTAADNIPTDNRDNALIHNLIAKTHIVTGGVDGRHGGFWITVRKNFFADNVVVSSQLDKTGAGYGFGGDEDDAKTTEGNITLPGAAPIMVRNEAHGNGKNGLLTWSNTAVVIHVVDLYAWRNGDSVSVGSGVSWGAYLNRWQLHRSRLVGNAFAGIRHTVETTHVQDTLFAGEPGGPPTTQTDYGTSQHDPTVVPQPTKPSFIYRNTFTGHSVGDINQQHHICDFSPKDGDDTDPDEIAAQNDPNSRNCIPNYFAIAGNIFLTEKLDFGWHHDRNTWWKFQDNIGLPTGTQPLLPTTPFYLYRNDNPDVTGYLTTEASADTITNVKVVTTTNWWDAPPTVELTSPAADGILGSSVTFGAVASDDKGVKAVQFFVDEFPIGTDYTAPYTFTWDASSWQRKRAYVYAKVNDTADQISYSAVYKLTKSAVPTPTFDFSLSNSGNIVVTRGTSGLNTITATLIGTAPSQPVTFSISGLPAGATYSFEPIACNPTCTTILTITTATTTPIGSSMITVTGTGGSLTRTTTFTLTVNAQPVCTLTSASITPVCSGGSSTNCEQGESVTMTGMYTGACEAADFFQIDASATGCNIQYTSGDISGISDSTITVSGGTISGASWTIPTIPATCSGKTVTATNAALYDGGAPGTGTWLSGTTATGSLTFISPPASFSFTLSNSGGITVTQGSSGSNTITATLDSGVTQLVTYSISGLPLGATHSFSSTSCAPTCMTTLTITTATTTPTGSYAITVTGNAAISGLTKTTQFTLTVQGLPPLDTIPPDVTITSPANNAVVNGVVTIGADATDNVAVKKVEFYVNSVLKNEDSVAPYTFLWDTNLLANGAYTLIAKAYDTSDLTDTHSITVTVDNTAPDTISPEVKITHPPVNKIIFGEVLVQANANDNIGVTRVSFFVDDNLRRIDDTSPYTFLWNTSLETNTTHSLKAKALDAAGNVGTDTITVTVDASKKIADVNNDGKVDISDVIVMILAWKSSGTTDLNKDGTTNLIDVGILLSKWTG